MADNPGFGRQRAEEGSLMERNMQQSSERRRACCIFDLISPTMYMLRLAQRWILQAYVSKPGHHHDTGIGATGARVPLAIMGRRMT